jgi:hypothetical protein
MTRAALQALAVWWYEHQDVPREDVVAIAMDAYGSAPNASNGENGGRRPARPIFADRLLLQVALDRVGRADLRLVGVASGITARAALAKQVPTPVKFDFDRLQPRLICLEQLGFAAVCLFAPTKLVLLGDKDLDSCRNALVAHPADANQPGPVRRCLSA